MQKIHIFYILTKYNILPNKPLFTAKKVEVCRHYDSTIDSLILLMLLQFHSKNTIKKINKYNFIKRTFLR